MKILILAENPQKISQLLRQDTDIKVIDELEISESTPFTGGIYQPGYSEYIINRAANFSKIYRASKILCIVIDQRHKNSLDKIPHDVSMRVYHSATPRKLFDSFDEKVNKIYYEHEFSVDSIMVS